MGLDLSSLSTSRTSVLDVVLVSVVSLRVSYGRIFDKSEIPRAPIVNLGGRESWLNEDPRFFSLSSPLDSTSPPIPRSAYRA